MLAKSAAFIEDIPIIEEHNSTDHTMAFNKAIDAGFQTSATNCFGAVGMYVGCLVFCLIQVFFNVKVANINADNWRRREWNFFNFSHYFSFLFNSNDYLFRFNLLHISTWEKFHFIISRTKQKLLALI